jgi:hypothetical protein
MTTMTATTTTTTTTTRTISTVTASAQARRAMRAAGARLAERLASENAALQRAFSAARGEAPLAALPVSAAALTSGELVVTRSRVYFAGGLLGLSTVGRQCHDAR